MTSTVSNPSSERVAFNRLLWAGPLTIIAATIVNVIIQQIAVALLQPDPLFIPLTTPAVIAFTVIGMLGAIIAYALIGRFSGRPIWLFRRVALITLLITFIPDILMLVTGFNTGTTAANVVVLIIMHIAAWAVAVGVLTRYART